MERTLKKSAYVFLSVGIAIYLIYTALPYYLLTTVSLPGWNIYWSYEDVQKSMYYLFGGLSLLGALTTLKKKNNVEDVFINVTIPLLVLLSLRCGQYYALATFIILVAASILTWWKVGTYYENCPYTGWKRFRKGYYIARKRMTYLLLFALTPLLIMMNYREAETENRVAYQTEATTSSVERESKLELVSEEKWKSLTVESKLKEIENYIEFLSPELGISSVKLYAVKELTDGRLAYYTYEEDAIYMNSIFLSDCTMRYALHVAAHELHHKHAHMLIDSLAVLEKAGIPAEEMAFFEEAVELKEASKSYYMDSLTTEGYLNNPLEVKAEIYADKQIKWLEEEGYLESK